MKTITFNDIISLKITAKQCVKWAKYVISHKNHYNLPPKTSIKFGDNCFFNTMPSLGADIFGVKVVSRIANRTPKLKSDILLYNAKNGELLALIDGTWITAMRTGAVAAITMQLLKKANALELSFIGLGNTARATLLCYDALNSSKDLHINLLAYKKQHLDFMKRFRDFKHIDFCVYDNLCDLASISDVLVSCVTAADSNFVSEEYFKNGVLIIPVHTRGFQNCDVVFDKIFCDDLGHISHFKYFNQYKFVAEITDILNGKIHGRQDDRERILAYNIGISIHDIYFAMQIYKRFNRQKLRNFWV